MARPNATHTAARIGDDVMSDFCHGGQVDIYGRQRYADRVTAIPRKPLTIEAVDLLNGLAVQGALKSAVETLLKPEINGQLLQNLNSFGELEAVSVKKQVVMADDSGNHNP